MMGTGVLLADPGGSADLVNAASWVRALVTGTTATVVATIAVGAIGFLMLQGRLPLRKGMMVVLGCFVIFGASSIASGLMAVSYSAGPSSADEVMSVLPPSRPPAPPQPSIYDPYAGASVPMQ